MHWDKIVGGISAVLSIIGAYLIWADAQRMTERTVDILLELTKKVGTWADQPWTQEQQNELKLMEKSSGLINKRGFVFLILGFFLQLISFFL